MTIEGFTEEELGTMVRFAASVCDEVRHHGVAGALDETLRSFSDPDAVVDLGARVWEAIIEAGL